MKWTLMESDEITAEQVYEILKHHRLLPASVALAASVCNSMAIGGYHFTVVDGVEEIANVFLSGVTEGEAAQLDLVPVARHFRTGFDEPFKEAMDPLLDQLFLGMSIRRITSAFPESRSRTKRALCSIGFRPEGRIREGVVLYNSEPEDIRILGLLKTEYLSQKESEGADEILSVSDAI